MIKPFLPNLPVPQWIDLAVAPWPGALASGTLPHSTVDIH